MEDKKFIEVTFPIKEVSKESVREKNIRHGHISTLHIWWARRPLASSRATSYAALIPAPKNKAQTNIILTITGSMSKYSAIPPATPPIILSFLERYHFFCIFNSHEKEFNYSMSKIISYDRMSIDLLQMVIFINIWVIYKIYGIIIYYKSNYFLKKSK